MGEIVYVAHTCLNYEREFKRGTVICSLQDKVSVLMMNSFNIVRQDINTLDLFCQFFQWTSNDLVIHDKSQFND